MYADLALKEEGIGRLELQLAERSDEVESLTTQLTEMRRCWLAEKRSRKEVRQAAVHG